MHEAAAISTDRHDDPQLQLPTLVVDAGLPSPDLSEQHHVDVGMKDHLSLPLLLLRTPDPATSSLPLGHGDMHSATSSSSSSSRESNNGSRQPPAAPMPPLPPRGISTSSTLGPSSPRTWRAFLHNHRRFVFLLFLVTALLVGGTFAMARYKDELLQGAQYIQDRAPLSAVYMALLLVLWIVLCLPATLLEVVAGMIYTWPVAVISITVGKQLGCNLGFWLGQCITTGSFKEAFLGRLTQREQEAVAREAAVVEVGGVEGVVGEDGGAAEAHVQEEEEPADIENSRTALQPASSRSSSSSSNGGSSSSSTPTHSALTFPSTSTTNTFISAAEPIAEVLPPTSLPSSLPPSSSSDLPLPLPPPTTTTTTPPPPPRRRRPKATPTEALMWAVKMHPWQICFLLRLLPVPIAVKNYGMSCLPFPVLTYTLCCFVAELPFTILWVHIGESCRSLLEAMEGRQKGKMHLMQEVLLLVLSVVLLVALGVLMRRYTAKYARHLEEEREKEEEEEEAEERRRVAAAAVAGAGVAGGEGQ